MIDVVTINFWGNEPDVNARLALAKRQLKDIAPDVIGMQEVRPLNGKNGPSTADVIAEALGMQVNFGKTLEWEDDAFFSGHPGGLEGLAIVSKVAPVEVRRLELPEPRTTEARILLSARFENPAPFWFHTTHLHYRLDDGCAREQQVVAIANAIDACGEGPHILCGDFNAAPGFDEIRFLRGETTLAGRRIHFQDAYARIHPDAKGHTWSAENPQTRPLRSLDIDRRIDYIFVSTRKKSGVGTIIDADLCLTDKDENGDAASDHYGVRARVQITASE